MVSANPTLNVQWNATPSGPSTSPVSVGAYAATREAGAGSSSAGGGGGFNPVRSWMHLYGGFVAQAQQEGEGLVQLGKLLGCGFAHRYAGLCSEQTYQQANRVFNNPEGLSLREQAGQLLAGATAPVRQAWSSGHKAEAAGRALWIGLSSITAAKGLVTRAGEGEALAPSAVRLSQSSVHGASKIAESMRANGWVGRPIDVVRMPDRGLTTIDNTRVIAANQAGIDVRATIHAYDEALPEEFIGRFTTPKGGVPSTWGEAIMNRIGGQNSIYRNTYPFGSPFTGWAGD